MPACNHSPRTGSSARGRAQVQFSFLASSILVQQENARPDLPEKMYFEQQSPYAPRPERLLVRCGSATWKARRYMALKSTGWSKFILRLSALLVSVSLSRGTTTRPPLLPKRYHAHLIAGIWDLGCELSDEGFLLDCPTRAVCDLWCDLRLIWLTDPSHMQNAQVYCTVVSGTQGCMLGQLLAH